jgi:hypothetical protein
MDSGAVTYIPNFVTIDSGIQKLIEGIYIHRYRQQGDLISLFSLFESRLKSSGLKILVLN